MIEPYSALPVLQRSLLEENCEAQCELYDLCGGSSTAPCGCVFDPRDEAYKNCDNCYRICRERESTTINDHFSAHAEHARSLSQTALVREFPKASAFPILIPTRTELLHVGVKLNTPWVAVDAKVLFYLRKNGTAGGRISVSRTSRFRESIHVRDHTQIMAVLNGSDRLLEGIWGMDRSAFFARATASGVSCFTGPTFSVTTEFDRNPASHNVLMMGRHNLLAAELDHHGFAVAPNIYWRRHKDIVEWAEWLRHHRNVSVISRDFSRTRSNVTFRPHLDGLLRLVGLVPPGLHVLLIGVGFKNGVTAMTALADYGATCSIVSADPILAGVRGGFGLRSTRKASLSRFVSRDCDQRTAALENLRVFEAAALDCAAELDVYEDRMLVPYFSGTAEPEDINSAGPEEQMPLVLS